MKEYKYKINGTPYTVAVGEIENNIAHVEVNGTSYVVELDEKKPVKVAQAPRAAAAPRTAAGEKVIKAPAPSKGGARCQGSAARNSPEHQRQSRRHRQGSRYRCRSRSHEDGKCHPCRKRRPRGLYRRCPGRCCSRRRRSHNPRIIRLSPEVKWISVDF